MRTTAAIVALTGLAVASGACTSGSSTTQSTTSTQARTPMTRPALERLGPFNFAIVYGRPSSLGTILSAPALSSTVYGNVHDTAQSSTCSGSCAAKWLPLTTFAAPRSSGGINPALLGTLVRADGQHQVTYDGHPLYTYSGDKHHLGLAGQGVDGSWFAIGASGDLVKGTP
jgi:predicted lipoprotein with Yx(FWY)xxD motif